MGGGGGVKCDHPVFSLEARPSGVWGHSPERKF